MVWCVIDFEVQEVQKRHNNEWRRKGRGIRERKEREESKKNVNKMREVEGKEKREEIESEYKRMVKERYDKEKTGK